MIKQLEIDIFEAPIDILVHQANCQCTMGSGIAKEIRKRFPQAYEVDCETKAGDMGKLGTYSVADVYGNKGVPCTNVPFLRYVVNLYSQFRYGTERRHTNYEAMYQGLESLRKSLEAKNMNNLVIGFPYKMGCNLGGGNWRIVQTIIEEVFEGYKADILICEKP